MTTYQAEFERWLDSPSLSEGEWRELDGIRGDDHEIESRFFAPLEFGTAGLRGTMKVGLHHMNVHVIRHATQAFADVISAEGEEAKRRGIAIAYDCRINSDVFAREAACVMAANGIHVRLFDALRPTPELSFAVRHYGTTAGLNITASHNPREYNGYKVYWSDGAQLPPQHAEAIAARMAEIDIFTGFSIMDFEQAKAEGLIEIIGAETDEAFLENVLAQAIDKEAVARAADTLEIVYTPFHGAGHLLVPEALRRLGIRHLTPVPEQMVIDGSFPTVESPNPENPEGFYLAVDLARKMDSDLIIGTDPDSDRIGVMVRKDGEYHTISGNQMGVLLLDYIIGAKKRTGTLPENAAALKTIVTTEMAAYYSGQGMTLLDALDALYAKYGNFAEKTMNLVMPGLDGLNRMKEIMATLRAHPLSGGIFRPQRRLARRDEDRDHRLIKHEKSKGSAGAFSPRRCAYC